MAQGAHFCAEAMNRFARAAVEPFVLRRRTPLTRTLLERAAPQSFELRHEEVRSHPSPPIDRSTRAGMSQTAANRDHLESRAAWYKQLAPEKLLL